MSVIPSDVSAIAVLVDNRNKLSLSVYGYIPSAVGINGE